MPKSFDLFFVSSNRHKYLEARDILDCFGINLGFLKYNLKELQSNSLQTIAQIKASDAFAQFNTPLIVEDAGLYIESLAGFPGPYSSFIFKTIGNKGILDLLKYKRGAKFISIITFCDKTTLESFNGTLHGEISKIERGKGWGFDPIFIPKNYKKTFAQINDKNQLSHRYKALRKFSKWYSNR